MLMRLSVFIVVLVLGFTGFAGAGDPPASLDAFHFMAGLSVVGAQMGLIEPPQCESFFKEEASEGRAAELFLAAARAAYKGDVLRHYNSPGKRLVIEHPALSKSLKAFYAPPNGVGSTELGLIHLDPQKRLSFLAGIYVRSSRNSVFHGVPSPAMRAAVLILLAEGCEVSELRFSEKEVPETMHFRVTFSKHVAEFFAAVDSWEPPHVEWKEK